MGRKKTILIAVMVNAGLLVVLFITALTTHDEIGAPEIAKAPLSAVNEPLMPPNVEMQLQNQVAQGLNISQSSPLEEIAVQEPKQATITHRLPPPVVEEKPAPKEETKTSMLEVTVKKGDNLAKIAKTHNTTVDEIVKINHLPGSFLKIGQVLRLPQKKSVISSPKEALVLDQSPPSLEYYTVKVGDNPWGIAMKHHIKMDDLLRLNHLNEEKARKLKPGDRLRIR